MKKVVFLVVMAALLAAPAMGAVSGTKHDLSSATGYAGSSQDSTGGTEICVFCHTPHGAATGNPTPYLPLWNRTIKAVAVNSVYNTSKTLSPEAVSVTTADVAGIDAALCLSCHDGSSLTDALNNPSNTDGAPTTSNVEGELVIDAEFNNDHPVAFEYDKAQSDDAELETLATAKSGGIPFFGNGENEMWCSSCHDVHSSTPLFLVKSNTGSALCLTCHIK